MVQHADHDGISRTPAANPAYAANQLAKALLASEQTADAHLAERAARRVQQWQGIMANLLGGAVQYGSRTPLPDTPAWATLEVATGGFATGNLLAGGPLEVYETELMKRLSIPVDDDSRQRLNSYFLTDQGMAELTGWLDDGHYAIRYPEEGALLAVAWMCRAGHAEAAREIVSAIAPFFRTLRFYPVPDHRPHRFDAGVYVQDVATTREKLRSIAPHIGIQAQRNTVAAWAPLHDRLLALFAETMERDDWPCQLCPPDWIERAAALLAELNRLDRSSKLPTKYRKAGSHYVQLRGYLQTCVAAFGSLPPKDLGRIRHIFRCSVAKRGQPLSAQSEALREAQRADVAAPLHRDIAKLLEKRLRPCEQTDGLDDPDAYKVAITAPEANAAVPAGTAIPASLGRKMTRCLRDSMEELMRRGLIASGEMMAGALPQVTSGLHSLGIEDPALRQLYAAIYRAFRRRRSLLLLNLESQVRIGELPWVSAIDRFRKKDLSNAAASRQALEQIVILALEHFPHAILPNKLVREIGALASRAGVEIPLVDELAADIFMGVFGPKFSRAAELAFSVMQGSLYANYYQIDAVQIGSLGDSGARAKPFWPWQEPKVQRDLAQLCAQRAGVQLGQWRPATNGMIIEQQQILTTQNLATLIAALDLRAALQERFGGMAASCFKWICSRNQMKVPDWHAQLIVVKNSAYAWRQMIFFLSMLPADELASTLAWMDEYFRKQPQSFRLRFQPVLVGLMSCATPIANAAASPAHGRQFLGWSEKRHWLMPRSANDEG